MEANLTVDQVAKVAGCHRNTVLNYEKEGYIDCTLRKVHRDIPAVPEYADRWTAFLLQQLFRLPCESIADIICKPCDIS